MFFLRKTIVLVLILALPAFLFAFGTQESGEQAGEQAEQQAEQPADQETAQQPADQAAQPADQQMAAAANLRLEDAIGMTAASEDGSVQGQIQDFVFSSAGDISHVVISFQTAGAAAGEETQPAQPADQGEVAQAEQPADQAAQPAQPADQQMAAAGAYLVPADRVTFEADRAVVQVTQDEIQSLPAMQDGNLPQDVAQGSILGSQLSNWNVVGQQGEEIGQVQGAMLNLAEKRWEYLAVAPAGVLGLSEQYYAVPADAVSEINPDQSQIMLSVTADQFGQYMGFGQDNWPQQAGAAGETQAAPAEQAPADQSAPADTQ